MKTGNTIKVYYAKNPASFNGDLATITCKQDSITAGDGEYKKDNLPQSDGSASGGCDPANVSSSLFYSSIIVMCEAFRFYTLSALSYIVSPMYLASHVTYMVEDFLYLRFLMLRISYLVYETPHLYETPHMINPLTCRTTLTCFRRIPHIIISDLFCILFIYVILFSVI